MELTLAILMVLGIFVGIPALIGFAIAGVFILQGRRVRQVEPGKTLKEELAQLPFEAPIRHEAVKPAAKTLVGAHQNR